jgi:glycosyltransferase involved in cell wall biosynthesis
MITYNQESYIGEAIESILMQKTNFLIELVIGEDCSTDRTPEICKLYKDKYPDIIKLRLSVKNVGMIPNFIENLKVCTGKYIAICEGDDYWTDPLKLQKQVDFLEVNPEFSLCFHNALVKHARMALKNRLFCDANVKEVTTIENVIENWYIPTASMVFRNNLITPLPNWYNNILLGDYTLHLLLADKGKIKYINEVMSIYRITKGSVSSNFTYNLNEIKLIENLSYFNQYTNFVYNDYVQKRFVTLSNNFYKTAILSLPKLEKIFTPYYWLIWFKSLKNYNLFSK